VEGPFLTLTTAGLSSSDARRPSAILQFAVMQAGLELRAAMSVSRLWRQQGKKQKARQMLADIYDWFTEGFETKDLQEAKALLQELT
jgi:predicted ATPase